MSEFETVERCAAYVAAHGALEAIRRAAQAWPCALGERARVAALATVVTTAESLEHAHASAARRRCIRAALVTALDLAEACDVARASGVDDNDVDEARRTAGRAIAMLGLLLHASASPVPED